MKTIFAIDNGSDPRVRARFERQMDTLRALQKLQGGAIRLCVGCWKGELESSYMLDSDDFDTYVRGTPYVAKQQAFLHTSAYESRVEWLESGNSDVHPPMRRTTAALAMLNEGWTCTLDNGEYWVVD